jgi:uncharacterized cupin superfamily protein
VVHESNVAALTLEQLSQASNTWDLQHASNPERYGFTRKSFTSAVGASKLGCSLMEVPPGKTAFPLHYHMADEEAIYILSGTGQVRLGVDEQRFAVAQGDYISFKTGPDYAHQLFNTHDTEPLRYLCISTEVWRC